MSLADIRTAIQLAMQTIPNIGIVNDFEPWARREEHFREYFWTPSLGYILGWTITRQATRETDDTHDPTNMSEHMIVIRGYRALSDGAATERHFQDLVEVVRTALRREQLGGYHFNGTCVLVGPPQVRTIEVRTFSDYLVHYGELVQLCTEAIKIV
jgi:hypothetical protein